VIAVLQRPARTGSVDGKNKNEDFYRSMALKGMEPHPFHERCLEFSARILRMVRELRRDPTLRSIADQLLRSGTSVGANTQEARSAESNADFIHKLHIALKESRETGYWLALIDKSGLLKTPELSALRQECNELTAMIVSATKTAGRRQ